LTTSKGRILGVDVGSKRVGLARTDPMRILASPIGTFSPEASFREIERQVLLEGPVIGIVVGWPLTPQGKKTTSTELVVQYINALRNKYKSIEIYKMDERYTSKDAMDILEESGVSKKRRNQKGRLDQAAAALILQQFIQANPEL
jgi:putative Holliday junction resolvase